MKKNVTKVILLVLSLAILVGSAIGISVSASDSAPEIISKNVKTNGNFCLMFAVDPATVVGDDVTITIYDRDPALEGAAIVETLTKSKSDVQYEALDGDGIKDDAVIVFETSGVAAKDIADVWYITAESAGNVSEVMTYSVMEYAFQRLYKDGTINAVKADGKAYLQQQFYFEILDMGSAAQALQVNYGSENPERLAKEYTYVTVKNGSYSDGIKAGFAEVGDVLTLTANDPYVTGWNVTVYGQNGGLISTQTLAIGDTLTVSGNTVVIPYIAGVTPGLYYAELGTEPYNFTGLIYKNLQGNQGTTHVAYLGHSGFSGGATVSGYSFDVVDEEHGAAFTVSKPINASKTCQGTVHFPVAAGAENANCVVFEFDFKYNGTTKHRFDNLTPDSNGELSTSVFFIGFYSNTLAEMNTWGGMAANRQFSTVFFSKDYDGVVDENNVGGDAFRIEGVKNSEKQFDLLPDTWYNICYEIYPEDNMCVIYVDGQYAGSWAPTTFQIADGDIDNINLVSVMMDYRLIEFNISFDNVFAGKIAKEYVAP